jgi:predicted PurR-regulated permease PerM
VHALESLVLTPIIQRQALDVAPATLFAFQILLGVVFGVWGLALALPLIAIAKVVIDYFKMEAAAAA